MSTARCSTICACRSAIGRPRTKRTISTRKSPRNSGSGYPQDNIIFEDSPHRGLIQNRQEVIRCPVDDTDKLERLLDLFFAYERPEIAEFRKAVEQFQTDLPAVLEALRE